MTDYTELKRLAEAIHGPGSTMQMLARWREFENACEPKLILALIAENERLAANVKLNLCDYPAIHSGDVDLLISFVSGTSQIALAEQHQCTPPNISRKIRRVKARLGWKDGMGPMEIRARAEQLRALASQGAVVTADLMVERDQLKAENEALRKSLSDCANELAAEIICKHGGQKLEDMHPVTRRLYERDMASVTEARAAIGQGERS